MSGGSYDYKYREIENLAEMLSPDKDEYQPIRDRMAKALKQIVEQCHDLEWTDSADYGEEQWVNIKEWLTKHNF